MRKLTWKRIVRGSKRRIVDMFLNCVSTDTLLKWTKKLSRKQHYPPVLTFHAITTPVNSPFVVSPSVFERICVFLIQNSFLFFFEKEWFATDKMAIIITCDDGHLSNYSEMFPILKKLTVKASVNVIENDLLEVTDKQRISISQAKELLSSGLVDIESHTRHHFALPTLREDQLQDEIGLSKEIIKEKLGISPEVLVYPYNAFDERVAQIASEHYRLCFAGDYNGDDKTTPIWFRIPRINVFETTTNRDLAKQLFLFTVKSIRLYKKYGGLK